MPLNKETKPNRNKKKRSQFFSLQKVKVNIMDYAEIMIMIINGEIVHENT